MNNNDLLQMRFPNRIRLTLAEACQALGISTATAHNHISADRFVLPILRESNRCYIHVRALAEYLDRLEAVSLEKSAKPARRGRPTKAEQKAREAMSAGEDRSVGKQVATVSSVKPK